MIFPLQRNLWLVDGEDSGDSGGVERESAGARLSRRLPRLPRVARQTWRAQIAGSGRWWYSACG